MMITILVPVYGVEQHIAECAETLFAQTYQDIEYVFCDDCTPDDSIGVLQRVLEKYPERQAHVRIVRNERNLGSGGTRKHLMEKIQSEYFCFVDSDDKLPLNAIETLARRMQETDADVVDGAYQVFTNDRLGRVSLPSHDALPKYRRKMQAVNLVRHQVWGRLYKTSTKDILREWFFVGIDMAEDYCVMARLCAVVTRAWTDEIVYLYRTEQQSFYSTQPSAKSIASVLAAKRQILSFYHLRGHLPLAVEIGMLDTYRMCRDGRGATKKQIDETLQYVPEHLTARLLLYLFSSDRIPYNLTLFLYKIIRWFTVR